MSRSLFVGRYQPFHDGHKKLIKAALDEGKPVLIAVRKTRIDKNNPYTHDERIKNIKEYYKDNPKVEVIAIPDIAEICYGRKVGYAIRRIRLDNQTEEISGTKIRNSRNGVVWLTGNVGAGKTSLAYLIKERLNAVVLDGDEMRQSISTGAGFSKKDRHEHNLRVARLANVFLNQGHNVVVSVIAPYEETRKEITKLIDPFWIYVKSEE